MNQVNDWFRDFNFLCQRHGEPRFEQSSRRHRVGSRSTTCALGDACAWFEVKTEECKKCSSAADWTSSDVELIVSRHSLEVGQGDQVS